MSFVSNTMKTCSVLVLALLLGCGSAPETVQAPTRELAAVQVRELALFPGRDAVRSGAIDFGASLSVRVESAEAARGIYGEPALLIRFADEDVDALWLWTAARKGETVAITFEDEVLQIASLEGRLGKSVMIPFRRPYSDETPAQVQARLLAALQPE